MVEQLVDYFNQFDSKKVEEYCREEFKKSHVDIYTLIQKAHQLTLQDAALKRKSYKPRNYMATVMNGNIIGLMNDNYSELIKKDESDCDYLMLSKYIRIYPKKLDDKYLPSNVITNTVLKRRGQEMMLDDEKIHVIYAGYRLDSNDWMKELQGVYASYINEYYPKEKKWIINLQEYVKSNSQILEFNASVDEQQLVTVPKIGIKKTN